MNEDRRDNQVRQRFDQLKRDDAGRTPSFATVWHRARTRDDDGRSVALWFRLAAAAAVIVALIVASGVLLRRGSVEVPATESYAVALSEWESPTQGLLQIPGQQFLSSVPQFDASIWETLSSVSDTKTIN